MNHDKTTEKGNTSSGTINKHNKHTTQENKIIGKDTQEERKQQREINFMAEVDEKIKKLISVMFFFFDIDNDKTKEEKQRSILQIAKNIFSELDLNLHMSKEIRKEKVSIECIPNDNIEDTTKELSVIAPFGRHLDPQN